MGNIKIVFNQPKSLSAGASRTSTVKVKVQLRESSLDSPHIKKAIDYLKNYIPIGEIKAAIKKEEKLLRELADTAPMMHNAMLANAAETAIFSLMEDNPDIPYQREVDGKIKKPTRVHALVMEQVMDKVVTENSGNLIPLRDAISRKIIVGGVDFALVPNSEVYDPKKDQGADTKTACCNDKAFVFVNKNFAQQLVNYAWLTEYKPKGKGYRSTSPNSPTGFGGALPDDLCFLEFLMAHEVNHFAYGDHYYKHYYKKVDHDTLNRAADYRINYELVKNGYDQLPMGLFSNEINFNDMSFDDMVEAVLEEKKKLREKNLDPDAPLNHPPVMPPGDGPPPEGSEEEGEGQDQGQGQGQDQGKDKKKGEKGQGKGQDGGEPGADGDGEQDQGKDQGQGKGQGDGEDGESSGGDDDGKMTKEKLDKLAKEIQKKAEQRKDLTAEEKKEVQEQNKKEASKSGQGGNPGSGSGSAGSAVGAGEDVEPLDWKKMLSKAIATVKSQKVKHVYHKMPKSGASRVLTGIQFGGQVVVPPAQILLKSVRVAIVVDSSGSMSSMIRDVFSLVLNLFQKHKKLETDRCFLLYKYNTQFEKYLVTVGHGTTFEELKKSSTVQQFDLSVDEQKPKGPLRPLESVITHLNGGTDFPVALVKDLTQRLAKDKYVVMLMSDSDILGGSNGRRINELLKVNSQNFYLIFDAKSTYQAALAHWANARPDNFTYIKKDR